MAQGVRTDRFDACKQLSELVATASEGKVSAAIERPILVVEETLQKPARRQLDDTLPRTTGCDGAGVSVIFSSSLRILAEPQ